MKKYILMLIAIFAMASCKKFLDVEPQSQIDETKLFTTAQGFKEALNGVYTLCASPNLYGGNLTFGSVGGSAAIGNDVTSLTASGGLDVLAQNYQFDDALSQSIENFNYTQSDFVATDTTIWDNAYRAIVNCNLILKNIEPNKNVLSKTDYQLIKGEALTLRAYLHFDLLRMYAPSYVSNAKAKAIPYVTTISVNSTPFSTVSVVLDSCLSDLNNASVLLINSDPILSGYTVGYPTQQGQNEDSNPDLFYQNRRHRMNYYTVRGELARVYLYEKDYTDALYNANLVINSKVFPWTNEADFFSPDITKIDRIFYKELISCWYIDDNSAISSQLLTYFLGPQPVFSATTDQISQIYEVAQDGADDWRYKQWFQAQSPVFGSAERDVLEKYATNIAPTVNLYPQVAPAMRLSEMYYIAAEASFETGDTGSALNYYNTIRSKRGIGDAVNSVADNATFINLLLTEARKEFYGESQIFYMYKRLNHGIPVSATFTRSPSNQIFVFPLPSSELEYRNN